MVDIFESITCTNRLIAIKGKKFLQVDLSLFRKGMHYVSITIDNEVYKTKVLKE